LYFVFKYCLALVTEALFEKRVLTRMFGPKRGELTGGCRKLHNEELHNFYSLPGIIKVIRSRKKRWAGHVARVGEMRNGVQNFGWKT
jgi:hypothetical protein